MKLRCLFVPLGVDSTPIGQRKQIAPLVAASAITGGAGLLGSLLGIGSQKKANEANLQATRETNQMNYQIANEANQLSQAQFNDNMRWLKEQYYDTENYKRVVEAARKAGLNPALALGSVSPIGSVGAPSQSQFHTAQMEAGHVEPVSYDALADSVGASVNSYYNNKLLEEQSHNVHADSLIKQAQAATEFMSRVADIRQKYADIELKMSQKGVSDATKDKLKSEKDKIDGEINLFWTQFMDLVANTKHQNRVLGLQGDSIEQDIIGKKIENLFKPAQIQAGIDLSNSQARSLIANLQLLAPQIALLASEKKLNDSKNIAQILMNGFEALDYKDKAQLADIYGKNGFTQKGKNFFYMLGDLLMHGLTNVKFPK